MLTLLNHPVSTCSQKVRLALHEKNLAFEDRWVDLKRQQHLEPAYLRPNGGHDEEADHHRHQVDERHQVDGGVERLGTLGARW